MRQIILDTETTGLSVAEGDRVIEIGCVELLNRQLTGNNLHYYLKVDRDSHPDALRVHGITTEFLKDKPSFAEKVPEFIEYLRDAELIIHNAAFDVAFLDNELRLAGRPALREHVLEIIDSLALAKQSFPGKRNSLDALCDRFGIDKSSRTLHGALLDSELLAQVYINLTRGQDALLMDADETPSTTNVDTRREDLSRIALPVIRASAEELAAHESMLDGIGKETGGKVIWRPDPAQAAAG
ncbi:DNA polymerase III subunit epsilon [Corticibacter populi]|uniref:DNA polymerase III subunit epsilon n=1 Tax=Corticibacter populi TaxID=1550736 RepID=A0A3M6QX86_9BURK|nr:DNA polymerase III subunit epsilon [Corticibacter populi]RMX07635.1 DNA polymerase III subunit epsilon [Corticibacter populi]RZS30136.1 DNA polymerase-3 subunit epsilon [Corticibacter populi]